MRADELISDETLLVLCDECCCYSGKMEKCSLLAMKRVCWVEN